MPYKIMTYTKNIIPLVIIYRGCEKLYEQKKIFKIKNTKKDIIDTTLLLVVILFSLKFIARENNKLIPKKIKLPTLRSIIFSLTANS